MSENAVITLDELIEEAKPMSLSKKIERIGGYFQKMRDLTLKMSVTFGSLASAADDLAATWENKTN